MVSQIFKKAEKPSIPQHITHAKRTQFRVAPGGEVEALARPEADSETSLARRGSGMVQVPDLRGDKSGVAGVELATASEPPARQPRIWERRPSGVDPRHP